MTPATFRVDPAAAAASFRAREAARLARRVARRLEAVRAVTDAISEVLPAYPHQPRVFLFGSAVRPGAFRNDSDVDVAIESAPAEEYFAIWRDLERAAPGWTVDLRVLADSEAFAREVRARGQLVYERKDAPSPGEDAGTAVHGGSGRVQRVPEPAGNVG